MFIYFTDYLYFKPFFVLLQIHPPRPLSPYGDGAAAHGHIQVNAYEYKHLFRKSRYPATSPLLGALIGVRSINLLKPHNIEQEPYEYRISNTEPQNVDVLNRFALSIIQWQNTLRRNSTLLVRYSKFPCAVCPIWIANALCSAIPPSVLMPNYA